MNTVQYTVRARSGAAVVIEVTYTSRAEAADALDLAYDEAKRSLCRDTGEVARERTAVTSSRGHDEVWGSGLPHA